MRNRIALAVAIAISASWSWAADSTIWEKLTSIESSGKTVDVSSIGQELSQHPPQNRAEAVIAVEALGNPSLAPYAQMAISKSQEPAVGEVLLETLRRLKTDLKAISNDDFKRLSGKEQSKLEMQALNVAAVIHALANVKYQPAIPDLRDLLKFDGDFEGFIALQASHALGELGDTQSYSLLMEKAGKEKFVDVSGYGSKAIRQVIEKIDVIDATFKTSPKKVNDPRDAEIDKLAQQLRANSSDPQAKEAFHQLLHHPRHEVRFYAAGALLWSMTPQDKAITSEMLQHTDPAVRIVGLDSLHMAKTWDKSFMPTIIDMIQHDTDRTGLTRGKAITVLVSLVGKGVRRADLQEAVPYLEAGLKDPHSGIRAHSFEALRHVTGRFYPYEGMPAGQKKKMEREPALLPENQSIQFKAHDENR